MVVEDLWGSIAHVTMLGRQGIVPAKDAAHIIATLVGFQDASLAGALDLKEPRFANHDGKPLPAPVDLLWTLAPEVPNVCLAAAQTCT